MLVSLQQVYQFMLKFKMADKMAVILLDAAIKYSDCYRNTLLKKLFFLFGKGAGCIGVVIYTNITCIK